MKLHLIRFDQLFEGRPSLKHLALWNPKGMFQDPIALAEGYDRFAAQWYGLPALFDPIKLQSHKVIDAGNPIVLEMSNKYVVKGIKQEKVMDSIIRITLGADGKIDKVEDRWNDKLPEGSVSEVSSTSRSTSKHGTAGPVSIRVPGLPICIMITTSLFTFKHPSASSQT